MPAATAESKDLPDAVVEQIIDHLSLKDWARSLAPVSKQLCALAPRRLVSTSHYVFSQQHHERRLILTGPRIFGQRQHTLKIGTSLRLLSAHCWRAEVIVLCLPSEERWPAAPACLQPLSGACVGASLRVLRLYAAEGSDYLYLPGKSRALDPEHMQDWLNVVATACPLLEALAANDFPVTSVPKLPALRHLVLELPSMNKPLLDSLALLSALQTLKLSGRWDGGGGASGGGGGWGTSVGEEDDFGEGVFKLELKGLPALRRVLVTFGHDWGNLEKAPPLSLSVAPGCQVSCEGGPGEPFEDIEYGVEDELALLQALGCDRVVYYHTNNHHWLLSHTLPRLAFLRHLHVGIADCVWARAEYPYVDNQTTHNVSRVLAQCPRLETATFEVHRVSCLHDACDGRHIRVPPNLRSLIISCTVCDNAYWDGQNNSSSWFRRVDCWGNPVHLSIAAPEGSSPGLQRLWLSLSPGASVDLSFGNEAASAASLRDLAIFTHSACHPHRLGRLLTAKVAQHGRQGCHESCLSMGVPWQESACRFCQSKHGSMLLPCKCGTCVECLASVFGGRVEVRKNPYWWSPAWCMMESDPC